MWDRIWRRSSLGRANKDGDRGVVDGLDWSGGWVGDDMALSLSIIWCETEDQPPRSYYS